MVEYKYEGELTPRVVCESLRFYNELYPHKNLFRESWASRYKEKETYKRIVESQGVAVGDYMHMIEVLAFMIISSWGEGKSELEFNAGEYNFHLSSNIKIHMYKKYDDATEAVADIVEGGDILDGLCLKEINIDVNMAKIHSQSHMEGCLIHELNHVADNLNRLLKTNGESGMGKYYMDNPEYMSKYPKAIMVNYEHAVNDLSPELKTEIINGCNVEYLSNLKLIQDICYKLIINSERNAFNAEVYSDLKKIDSKMSNHRDDVFSTESWKRIKDFERGIVLLNNIQSPEFWYFVLNYFLETDVTINNAMHYKELFLQYANAYVENAKKKIYKIAALYYKNTNQM